MINDDNKKYTTDDLLKYGLVNNDLLNNAPLKGDKLRYDPYELWLYYIDGFGRKKIATLLGGGISPRQIYEMPQENLMDYIKSVNESTSGMEGISQKNIAALLEAKQNADVLQITQKLKKYNVDYISVTQQRYPMRLREIFDAPFALFQKGLSPINDNKEPAVAVIGARKCSPYGRYIATVLGEKLAQEHIQLVSGLASGIDGISQRSAFLKGGFVTAVLGCGVDICYPKENIDIYNNLSKEGRILSEYIPGTQPLARYFPPRNRIISGLCDAVIVVEAQKKSGTLITVDMALEQGKDVYIIPGRLTDPMSYGCNRLISQGAEIVYDIDEMISRIQSRFYAKILHEKVEEVSRNRCMKDQNMLLNMNNPSKSNAEVTPYSNTNQTSYSSTNKNRSTKSNTDTNTNTIPYPEGSIEYEICQAVTVMPLDIQKIYNIAECENKKISIQELSGILLHMELYGIIDECGGFYRFRESFPEK